MRLPKRRWCRHCKHFCPTEQASCSCAVDGHRYDDMAPAGPHLFARRGSQDAALLSGEAALKLGFDATQICVEAQYVAALRRQQPRRSLIMIPAVCRSFSG
jgi:hypothetical protein